nr:unnamed protein product [Hydra vulgaris]
MNLWSILCRIVNSKPFIVALYYGKSKPSNIYECMLEFLNEYKQPQLDGIYFGQKKYNVVIRALICDAPARAFIKGIVNHNGYNACERCTVKGVWNGRVIYKNHIVQDLRTDEKFNEMGYKAHQITISPLISINVKCVQEFSLDYMHLVCAATSSSLGILKSFGVIRAFATSKLLVFRILVARYNIDACTYR